MEKESLENKYNDQQQKLLDEIKDGKKKIDALIKVLVHILSTMMPFLRQGSGGH